MKKTSATLLLALLSLSAHCKTDIGLQNKDKVFTVTETVRTCPRFTAWGCIMRMPPQRAYVPVHSTHVTDAQGNETSCSYYNQNGDLIYTAYYSYNAAGTKIATEKKGRDGTGQSKVVYSYNAEGYPTKTSFYYADARTNKTVALDTEYFKSRNTYRYNDQGVITEWDTYKENGDLSYKKLSTPQHPIWPTGGIEVNPDHAGGSVTTTQPDKKGKMLSMLTRKFDAQGNIVQATSYDNDSSIVSITYYKYAQVDAHGNWHKATYWTQDDTDDFNFPSTTSSTGI